MYIGLHVKYPLFLSDFKETRIFTTFFEKFSYSKFHENPSSGSRVVPRGHTDRHDEAASLRFFAVLRTRLRKADT